MATYGTFPLNPSLSGQNLVGQTPPVGGGNLYQDAGSNPISSGNILIDANGYVYCNSPPSDQFVVGIPTSGSFTASHLQVTFDLQIITLVGNAGVSFGCSSTTGQTTFTVAYDANNLRWTIAIRSFERDYVTSAHSYTAGTTLTGLRAVCFTGPGGLTTITLFDNLGNVLVTGNFAAIFAIIDGGFWFQPGTTGTATTGVHIGNLVIADVPTTPTGTALSLTGFAWDGSSTPNGNWQGNASGSAAHGSKTPMLVSLVPVFATSDSAIIFTPSDNGAGGTFSASTYTLNAGQTSMVIYYTPPATGSSVNISIANNASITAITNQAVPLTANLVAVLSNSLGAGFGLPSISQSFPSLIAGNVSDYTVYNFSISGLTTSGILAAMNGWIGPGTGLQSAGINTVIFFETTNEIASGKTAAQALTNALTVYTNAKSYGYTNVVASGLMARTGMSETVRTDFNTGYSAAKGAGWDRFCPIQHDWRIGSAAFAASPFTYNEGDGVHLNFTGQSIFATYQIEAIEPGATGTPLTASGSGGVLIRNNFGGGF